MKILCAIDDPNLGQALELMLTAEGARCEFTDTGDEAFELAAHYTYDVVLIDDQLDDMSGKTVLQGLRLRKLAVAAIMLTDNRDTAWECRILELGADDVVHKPLHRGLLLSRIRAVTRRWNGHAASKLQFGPLTIDLAEKRVSVASNSIHLTGREYQMLEALALRAGSVQTKQHLMDACYGGMDEPEIKIIDVFICKIRTKIREAGGGDPIRTIWGRGYMIDPLAETLEPIEKPGRAPGASWDAQAVDTLQASIKRGMSAGETAAVLGRTRSAVMAYAYRRGWRFGKGMAEA